MPFSLQGRTTLVTGAGRGIGRTIAKIFAEAGSRVLVVTRGESAGAAAVKEIVAAGGDAKLHTCDLASALNCRSAVDTIIDHWGRLDILIHNAGVYPICSIEEMTEEVLDSTLNVNLKAAFWLTQAALPHLKKAANPRLLFTSSVTGPRVVLPGLAHYAASKSGLNGFIRSAAMEFAKYRITANGVEPGLIRTEAIDALGNAEETAAMASQIPLKRFGTTAEIAYAMLYLASDEAAFVTGQTLIVDGGALLPENSSALE